MKYYEEGWLAEVYLVKNLSKKDWEGYRLKVIRTLTPSPTFNSIDDGEVFQCGYNPKYGGYMKSWRITA